MAKTLKWTWGKYNGLFKDKEGDSFDEMWTYENDGDEQYKEMERRAIELVKAGYLPEKIEEVSKMTYGEFKKSYVDGTKMTLGEFTHAYKNGKIVVYDIKSERGYVSRRLKDSDNLTTGVAKGFRAGEKYVLLPRWDSTSYCYRVYYKEACKK